MAGSRKFMIYEADDGQSYGVSIDESNGEVADFDDYDSAASAANIQAKPDYIKMRYVTVVEPNSGSTRKIYVGKPTSDLVSGIVSSLLLFAFSGNSAGSAIAWMVSNFVGEQIKRQKPIAIDTGFTDGDNT